MSIIDGATIFLLARRSVSRSACSQFLKAHGIGANSPEYERAKLRWHSLPLLQIPALRIFSMDALAASLGTPVVDSTPFHATVWTGGVENTYNGQTFDKSISTFVELLQIRSRVVAPKKEGWVITPTTNLDGHRCNASTISMSGLNLDCDGTGNWNEIINILTSFNVSFIVYESGGATKDLPKWHLLLSLSKPFDTSSPEKIIAWKEAYDSARTVFGSLAWLSGEGFDPAVSTSAIPVFGPERRKESDPLRRIIFKAGHSLDLESLINFLPKIPKDGVLDAYVPKDTGPVEAKPLDNARLEEIVTVLCRPMSKILSGRRDLYMALSGSLLERGIVPDDVLAIIDSVSSRCPGDPSYSPSEIESKHKEHLHGCVTTTHKHKRHEPFLQVGTLVSRWPEVIAAIDEVLPHPFALAARRLMDARLNQTQGQVQGQNQGQARKQGVSNNPKNHSNNLMSLRHQIQSGDTSALSKETPKSSNYLDHSDQKLNKTNKKDPYSDVELIKKIKFSMNNRLKSKEDEKVEKGILLRRLLMGDKLVEFDDPDLSRESAVAKVGGMLAQIFEIDTGWDPAMRILLASLTKMTDEKLSRETLLLTAKSSFEFVVGSKLQKLEELRIKREKHLEVVKIRERERLLVEEERRKKKTLELEKAIDSAR